MSYVEICDVRFFLHVNISDHYHMHLSNLKENI